MNLWNYNKNVGIGLDKSLGNTNTHYSIAEIMVRDFIVEEEITKNHKFLEPAVGAGSFYFAILNKLMKLGFEKNHIIENMIFAYDVDSVALSILEEKLRKDYEYSGEKQKIFHCDFLTKSIEGDFDYVITNPPYISSKNIKQEGRSREEYLSEVGRVSQINFDGRSDVYMMFFLKTLKMLRPNGRQIFLCSDSWIDCGYGDLLKEEVTGKYSLEYVVNSQLYPFFRDDTSAVITVIKNDASKDCETKLISIKSNIDLVGSIIDLPFTTLNKSELLSLFKNDNILNKRNVLVLHGDKYEKNKSVINKYEKFFTKTKNIIDISSTGTSKSKLEKEGLLLPNDGDGVGVPVFWQIQARVNKKPNYKNKIECSELPYKIDTDKISGNLTKLVRDNSVYMSGIIDRFPLIFFTNGKTFHVSKYLHLNSDILSKTEVCLTMNSVFTYYNMELDLKEGTRKTLRVGEMGLTKEIKRQDLENIRCIDFTKFTESTRKKISELGEKYQSNIVYSIETAIQDKNYMAIQELIKEEIGMSNEDFNYILKGLMEMYYFRMRNLAKIKLFKDEYE